MTDDTIVLIWSGEHRAWWRSLGRGYTYDRDQAGRWYLADARRETASCGPEKQIQFHEARRPEVEAA